jgi:hypothetical protein
MTANLIDFVSKLNIAIEQMDELMTLIAESEEVERNKIKQIHEILCEPNTTD